ncbi:hypothetical protein EYF80_027214 [Liparis tanakae]|uniref:Uncharacterized protein n=1 Tax=Liparis tanakae TaxID=230148 RepID=A0A4Z2HBH0_9TELE|nr:hypothetical protein EYF80_027214 [Liparis tanakae]
MLRRLSQPPPGSTSSAVMERLEEARHCLSQLVGRLMGTEEQTWRRERARRVSATFMMTLPAVLNPDSFLLLRFTTTTATMTTSAIMPISPKANPAFSPPDM